MSTQQTSLEEQERVLKIILTIEASGGSAGYKSNPELFQEFADELYTCKTEEDLTIECLEEIKTLNGLGDSVKNMKVLESRIESHGDHRVRALLPKFTSLKSNMQDLHAFDSLIKDVRALSELRKGEKTGMNQRVLQTIESMEALGGSVGFQKYISEMQATAGKVTEQAISKAAENDDDSWRSCWGNVFIVNAVILTSLDISCSDAGASGTGWGVGLVAANVWGWLRHASPRALDKSATTVKLKTVAAVAGDLEGWFTRISDDELIATFVGAGVGLGYALSLTGRIEWWKR